jgi:hypothetical protein
VTVRTFLRKKYIKFVLRAFLRAVSTGLMSMPTEYYAVCHLIDSIAMIKHRMPVLVYSRSSSIARPGIHVSATIELTLP